ncbi:MAG TPA: hypothetical protein PLO89_03755, partial [Spirochaetota bacterium]|nr:hypothetical protein [Spirochaetota bacterium]
MNINTGKLASNSEAFLKKIKEQENGKTVSSINEKSQSIKKKLLNDFADIKFADSSFKGRLLSNNFKLSEYELEYSKNQFVEERLKSLENAYEDNDLKKVTEIINHSVFNNKNVLKDFFPESQNIDDAIYNAKSAIEKNFKLLSKEYKSIEVASQNILSVNQDSASNS